MKFLALLLLLPSLHGQIYDYLFKNGRVIDPANLRDARIDIAVSGNKIVRVATDLPSAHARVVIDVSAYLVTPGLIDIDAHFGSTLKPDYNTLPYGVTSAVEASTPCEKEIIAHAKLRIVAFPGAGCRFAEAVIGTPPATSPLLFSKAAPEVISSHMDWNSILIPRANMATAMSIYLTLGMSPEQIIERVTANAARAINRPDLGNLKENSVADIAVLELQDGNFGFLDSARTRVNGTRRFHCVLTMRNGAIVWDSEALTIPDTLKAGPYTNFK